MIKAEVLSSIDSAQTCFALSSGKTRKVPCHSWQDLRCDIECEFISEIKCQHCCGCTAVTTMSTRIGRIRRGFGRQRQPIGICQLRRSHRPPEVIDVLGFEE